MIMYIRYIFHIICYCVVLHLPYFSRKARKCIFSLFSKKLYYRDPETNCFQKQLALSVSVLLSWLLSCLLFSFVSFFLSFFPSFLLSFYMGACIRIRVATFSVLLTPKYSEGVGGGNSRAKYETNFYMFFIIFKTNYLFTVFYKYFTLLESYVLGYNAV
jgi:hypothetical protein